jgi:hypothetical protein
MARIASIGYKYLRMFTPTAIRFPAIARTGVSS